jgi:hypothetical protein
VQPLLRVLRKSAEHRLIAETVAGGNENAGRLLGAVDGSGYGGPDPPTAPLPAPASPLVQPTSYRGPPGNILR